MKTKITLTFLVLLFCTASIVAQKKIMFVGTGTAANADDAIVIAKLQGQGFTVTFISQNDVAVVGGAFSNATTATTFTACDAVVASSSISSGNVVALIAHSLTSTVSKPYMTWETANYDELGITTATQGYTPRTVAATPNTAANIKFNGSLTTIDYATTAFSITTPKPGNTLAAGAINIASAIAPSKLDAAVDTTVSIGVYLPKGATAIGTMGASGADVIAMNILGNSNPNISFQGWEFFLRAVCVLADKVYTAPTGLKDIASYDVNSKMWYANGNLNMDIWKNLKNSQLSIYNTEGKLISKTQISGSGLFSVPVSNLKNGLYMVVGEGFKGKFIKN